MSYTIDVYRKDAPVQRNMVDFGAFVTMFPQLIAGPIVQYKTVAADLRHRLHTSENFALGGPAVLRGTCQEGAAGQLHRRPVGGLPRRSGGPGR